MTKLQKAKPLVRETGVRVDGRELVVEIGPNYVEMWLKGRPHERWAMDWKRVYAMAVSLNFRAARKGTAAV